MAARTRTMRSIRADRRPPGRPEIGPTMMPSAADRLQERSPEPAACRPRRRRLGRALTGSLIAALTLAATGCATELPSRPESPPEVLLLPDRSRDARTPADWEAVSRKALPSVVALRIDHGLTKSAGDWGAAIFDSFKLMFRNPIGGLLDFLGNLFIGWIDLVTVEGTGFVLTKDGLVLTNAHVARDPDTIRARRATGGATLRGELLAISDSQDLALIQLRDARGEKARTEPVRLRDQLALGGPVAILGFPARPYGGGGANPVTLTTGVISSAELTIGGVPRCQTDAASNAGASGSPLLDRDGAVLGIVTEHGRPALLEDQTFAIPVRQLEKAGFLRLKPRTPPAAPASDSKPARQTPESP